MRKILTSLLLALEAAIEYRLQNGQEYLVKGLAADTLAYGVRTNLEGCQDAQYADTTAGRIDAYAMMDAIKALLPAILK